MRPDPPLNVTENLNTVSATARLFTPNEPLVLASGAELAPVDVAYETYGELNPQGSNAIFVCHALTGDAHAAGLRPGDRKPGWWDNLIGPGKAVDTNRWFVVCANILGGCRGTTGPSSVNPATGEPYGLDFPLVAMSDFVAEAWQKQPAFLAKCWEKLPHFEDCDQYAKRLDEVLQHVQTEEQLYRELRLFRAREMVKLSICQSLNFATVEQVFIRLSQLAESLIIGARDWLYARACDDLRTGAGGGQGLRGGAGHSDGRQGCHPNAAASDLSGERL